jgi:hypothetical protein
MSEDHLVEKLRQLEQKKQDLMDRRSRVLAVTERAMRDKERCEKEMRELNTSPETIEADIKRYEEEELKALELAESLLIEYEKQLEAAEKLLATV